MRTDCETESANQYPQKLRVRSHSFRADLVESSGGTDSAPGPHDYFDAALASCKALTALWYAKKNGLPLEKIDVHVDSNDSEERAGKYSFTVSLDLHGPLDAEQKRRIHAAVLRCPIHKLMTTADIVIETTPLEEHA